MKINFIHFIYRNPAYTINESSAIAISYKTIKIVITIVKFDSTLLTFSYSIRYKIAWRYAVWTNNKKNTFKNRSILAYDKWSSHVSTPCGQYCDAELTPLFVFKLLYPARTHYLDISKEQRSSDAILPQLRWLMTIPATNETYFRSNRISNCKIFRFECLSSKFDYKKNDFWKRQY